MSPSVLSYTVSILFIYPKQVMSSAGTVCAGIAADLQAGLLNGALHADILLSVVAFVTLVPYYHGLCAGVQKGQSRGHKNWSPLVGEVHRSW